MSGEHGPELRAEDVFWQYLIACETDPAPDFGSICREHPTLSEELQRLKVDWEHLAGVLTRLEPEGSISERLVARFGPEVDPGIQLDGEPPGAAGTASEPAAPAPAQPAPAQAAPPQAGAPQAGAPQASVPFSAESGNETDSRLLSSAVRGRLLSRRTAFSRYRIHEQIGRGGMGVIFDAWEGDLRRHLAMKVLRTDHDSSVDAERRLGRFLEEAQITGQLDHPGIVPVHELGLDEQERVYFTMKLVRGKTLKEVFEEIAETPQQSRHDADAWTITRALGALQKVCEAMAYAHAKGVVHRDLKPANIMVGRFGEVYVMDWGLAHVLGTHDRKNMRVRAGVDPTTSLELDSERRRFVDESGESPLVTMDGDVVGTPAYMPPEQAAGRLDDLGPRSDVYAVGAMLYHLITGQMPYSVPGQMVNHLQIWSRVQEGSPRRVGELAPRAPAEIIAICERAMRRDPAERYADMGELADDLRAYLERRVVRAYSAGPVEQLRKWVVRNKVVAALLSAVVLIVATAGFIVAWEQGRTLRAQVGGIAQAHVQRAQASWPTRRASIEPMRAYLASVEVRLRPYAAEVVGLEPSLESVVGDEYLAEIEDELAVLTMLLPSYSQARERDEQWLLDESDGNLEEDRRRRISKQVFDTEIELLGQRTEELRFRQRAALLAHGGKGAESGRASALSLLFEPRHGLVHEVEQRVAELEQAEPLLRDERWALAIDEISDTTICPAYGCLQLEPQFGLLPLRRDPRSGLWEFLHVFSGQEPVVAADDRYLIDQDTGIVLVLIPGGSYVPGAPGKEESEVTLAAFFMGKYEVTQGQWWRVTGQLPSEFHAGMELFRGEVRISRAHPVENVDQISAREAMALWDLLLPREVQWEYAARAGGPPTCERWDYSTCFGDANFYDRSAAIFNGRPQRPEEIEAFNDDGWVVHAPVGDGQPNLFGLHFMLGNVAEWCADRGRHELPVGRPVGSHVALEFGLRGSSFETLELDCTPTRRDFYRPYRSSPETGLRVTRAIDRP